MKPVMIALISAATLLGSTAALADEGDTFDVTEQVEGDYTVSFFDDDLNASAEGAMGDVIRIPPMAVRRTLLRPRVSFVRALIFSVENL